MPSSPEVLRTSTAAALSLRLAPGRFSRDVELGGINVLLDYERGCHANCAYCGLARERPGAYDDKSFIRVDWPTYPTDRIVEQMAKHENRMGRFCISQVVHQRTPGFGCLDDHPIHARRMASRVELRHAAYGQ